LEINIRNQRWAIALHLKQVPSLKAKLNDAEWWEVVCGDSVTLAAKETGIGMFPVSCPWTFGQIMDVNFWPSVLGDW
jgi:hypothetical protein